MQVPELLSATRLETGAGQTGELLDHPPHFLFMAGTDATDSLPVHDSNRPGVNSRTLCAYPKQAMLKPGAIDTADASSFVCRWLGCSQARTRGPGRCQ